VTILKWILPVVADVIELLAAEVRGMEKPDLWRRAFLVAQAVEPGVGQGQRTDLELPHDEPRHKSGEVAKVSAAAFARIVDAPGFSDESVRRMLRVWDHMADRGELPVRDLLVPGVPMPEGYLWPPALSWKEAKLAAQRSSASPAPEPRATGPRKERSSGYRQLAPPVRTFVAWLDEVRESGHRLYPDDLNVLNELINKVHDGLDQLVRDKVFLADVPDDDGANLNEDVD
jgi:hypothetical protein